MPGDIIILLLCTKNLDVRIYSSWDIRVWRTEIGNYGSFSSLLPSPPLKKKKKKSTKSEFQKNKKILLEISSFYTCVPKTTIIWGTVPEIQIETGNFLSFSIIFCPFTLLTAQKNQNFVKHEKRPRDIIILHKCTKDHDQMLYSQTG